MYTDEDKVKIVALFVALFVAIGICITFIIHEEDKCKEIGGTLNSQYEYTEIYTDPNGGISSRPVYSYHCIVNGEEVDI